jgi:hypothetical protein
MKRDQRNERALVFRGTVLGPTELAQIRRLVVSRQQQTRQEIAGAACRLFGWRCDSGAWAVRASRDLLVRLERAGLIRLPAARRPQGRPRREALELATRMLAPLSEAAWEPPARATLLVRPICADELLGWRAYMERYHYLGDAAVVGESLRYAAFLDGELVALLGWGSASLHNGPRDRYLGWDAAAQRANLQLVVNNVRFLMLVRQRHLASRVLGANLRRLSRDWQARYGHPVVMAETFVDRARFRGTCYRASNWQCVGETQGWSKRGQAYRFHGQPKSVWLYPLTRDFNQRLRTTQVLLTVGRRMTLDVEKLPLEGEGGLFPVLGTITDPRKRRGVRHKVQSVIAIAVCATLAGARSFIAIAEWAAEQSREVLLKLGSKRGRPPSERTIRRVLQAVDAQEVDRLTGTWVAQQVQLQGSAISVDGKTLRGSRDGEQGAVHLLSVIVHGTGTVVAQVAVGEKTNEIPCIKPLLADLDLKGAVVTADALHTQRETARYIVEDKDADYVFTVKGNQPTLRQDIETLHLDAFPPSAHNVRQRARTH